MPILIAIFAVLAGLAFGSFLNVCVSRLPRHESVVAPRSRCPQCLAPIRVGDNLPVLSWLLLRGRCRDCGVRIPARYPLIEATASALFLLCFLEFGLTPRGIASAAFCWLLLGLAATDAETMLLPDALTLPGLALGVVCSLFRAAGGNSPALHLSTSDPSSAVDLSLAFDLRGGAKSLVWAVCAAAFLMLVRGLYWLVRRREGLGLGDVKLLAMIAAWLGWERTLLSLVLGVIAAAAYGLALIAWRRAAGGEDEPLAARIPLGAFLSAAGLFTLFQGEPIIKWYGSFFG